MTTTSTVLLLDPSAEDEIEQLRLAPRLASLKGTVIGLVDNGKRNSDVFLETVGRLLMDQYGVKMAVPARKAKGANSPAASELLDSMAGGCDAVVHAIAD
ncbi:MAG: hypothetical protein HYY00_05660 [Chloroflexi bacterium]|nr:hypothetical protein [Chloroflexota bacterium]